MPNNDWSVRPYVADDESAVRRICVLTGHNGEDASGLYRFPELLPAVYASPYVEREPGLAWVAVGDAASGLLNEGSTVCGYVLGTLNTRAFEEWRDAVWYRNLVLPAASCALTEADRRLLATIAEPPQTPEEIALEYPSELHIDLLPVAQGRGLGGELMRRFTETLRESGSAGVHLGVSRNNRGAIAFYEHFGFRTIRAEEWGLWMGLSLG